MDLQSSLDLKEADKNKGKKTFFRMLLFKGMFLLLFY